MTIRAVFADRLVLPEERAALVGVALEAGLVDRVHGQQFRRHRAVRIVATRASHLAGVERMRGELLDLRTLLLVAFEADGLLLYLVQDRVVRGVDFVAAGAGNFIYLMLASGPVRGRITESYGIIA